MDYREEMTKAMDMLSEHSDTIFIGQSVCYPGTTMYGTLKNVPIDKRLEFPVCEDFQMGFTIGQAIYGFLPISIFPRMDFLLIAFNGLINHLDKWEALSEGRSKPKVIIRTSVGGRKQLDPGLQHIGNYGKEIDSMCDNIKVVYLDKADIIYPCYKNALESKISTILIEFGDMYD